MTRPHDALSTLPKSALGLFLEASSLSAAKVSAAETSDFSDLWMKTSENTTGSASNLVLTKPVGDQFGAIQLVSDQNPDKANFVDQEPSETSVDFGVPIDLRSLLLMSEGREKAGLPRQPDGHHVKTVVTSPKKLDPEAPTKQENDARTTESEGLNSPNQGTSIGLDTDPILGLAAATSAGRDPNAGMLGTVQETSPGGRGNQTATVLAFDGNPSDFTPYSSGKGQESSDRAAAGFEINDQVETERSTTAIAQPWEKSEATKASSLRLGALSSGTLDEPAKAVALPLKGEDKLNLGVPGPKVSSEASVLAGSLAVGSSRNDAAQSTEKTKLNERVAGISIRPADAFARTDQPSSSPRVAEPNLAMDAVQATHQPSNQSPASDAPALVPSGLAFEAAQQTNDLEPTGPAPVSAPEPQVLEIDTPEWEMRLVDRIAANLNDSGASIELVLTPENLGLLEVQIELKEGKAEVSFVTETREAARLISQSEGRLSDLLARHGFNLGGQDTSSREEAARQNQHVSESRRGEPRDETSLADRPILDQGILNLMA